MGLGGSGGRDAVCGAVDGASKKNAKGNLVPPTPTRAQFSGATVETAAVFFFTQPRFSRQRKHSIESENFLTKLGIETSGCSFRHASLTSVMNSPFRLLIGGMLRYLYLMGGEGGEIWFGYSADGDGDVVECLG